MAASDSEGGDLWQVFERLEKLDAEARQHALEHENSLAPAERARLEAMLSVSEEAEQKLHDVIEAGWHRHLGPSSRDEETSADATTEAFGLGARPLTPPGLLNGDADTPTAPRRFGPYEVLREIGRGGLSTVYLAERIEPRMHVAIKVVRPDMASPEMHERLRRERQILAELIHPHIARLFDGGSVDGAPYFVMEHIEGDHIDAFCREHQVVVEVCRQNGLSEDSPAPLSSPHDQDAPAP